MTATPTVIAAGATSTAGSGLTIPGAGAATDEWDLVIVGSETTVDGISNAAGALTKEIDATATQGAYMYAARAAGDLADDIVLDTNGDHRTVYVWLRLPSNVLAVDVAVFQQAAASDETGPAIDTGALAEADELVVYALAGRDFSGTVTPDPLTFDPSAGYGTLANPLDGSVGDTTAHFLYVMYRDDAGTAPETPNVTWGTGTGSQNTRHRYAMVLTFTTDSATPTVVSLTPATAAWSAVAVDPDPQPVAVALTPATAAWSGVAVDPDPQPVVVALTAAVAALAGVAVDPDPGAVMVALTPAAAALAAVALSPVAPSVVTLTPAILALAAVAVHIGGELVVRPNTGLVVRPFTGTVTRP